MTYPKIATYMTQNLIDDIELEIVHGNKKHGHAPLATDDDTVLILVEEIGEYAQAILQGKTEKARQELIQIAAVAINHLNGTGPHRSKL
jgi:NTP pyrophosphatase (non-canonical NTP hydrolase)